MNDCVLSEPFDTLKNGLPEAYQHYFNLHCPRIYYYLLRCTRNAGLARSLSENTFIALSQSNVPIRDEDHLLRRLYLIARVCVLLFQKGRLTTGAMLEELQFYTQDDPNILDDPEVARNESLLALQEVLQKLSPDRLEIAELFFFQGLTVRSIALYLHTNEEQVKDYLTQAMQKLNDELSGRSENRRTGWRSIPALTPITGEYAA